MLSAREGRPRYHNCFHRAHRIVTYRACQREAVTSAFSTGATGPTGPNGAAGAVTATVDAVGTTTSTTYGDLTLIGGGTSTGPSTAFTVPDSGRVLVIVTAQIFGSTGNAAGFMTVTVDGATTFADLDANSLRVFGNDPIRASATALITTTPGTHTFTAVYRLAGTGTATFSARSITLIPA